jgi:hypothetical protein
MAGKPGRYMSIEKGLRAVRLPKMRISEIYRDLVIQMMVSVISARMASPFKQAAKIGLRSGIFYDPLESFENVEKSLRFQSETLKKTTGEGRLFQFAGKPRILFSFIPAGIQIPGRG